MDNPPQVLLRHSIKAKLLLFGVIFTAMILAGNWFIYYTSSQRLSQEVQTRGIVIARQAASHVYPDFSAENLNVLKKLSDGILHEHDDVRYVLITDEYGEIIVSTSHASWDAVSLPDPLHSGVCYAQQPVVRKLRIAKESIYDIGARIFLPALSSSEQGGTDQQTPCLGTLHLGLSYS